MAEISNPPRLPINVPLYTMSSLPDVAESKNQFIQVSDISGAGVGLMYSDGTIWRSVPFSAQRIRVQTAADGTYTWTYGTPFASGVIPKVFVVAESPAGATDIYNAQVDGTATNTSCKVRVTRGQTSAVALLGLTILSFPATPGVTWVNIVALA